MNSKIRKLSQRGFPLVVTQPSENCKVISGLAYTPAQVASATERGFAVNSATTDSMFFDGFDNPSFDVPIELKRSVDAVAVWEAQKTARKRIIDAHKNDKAVYG